MALKCLVAYMFNISWKKLYVYLFEKLMSFNMINQVPYLSFIY